MAEWDSDGEVEKLETDVREICNKIFEYRHTPNIHSGSDPLPSSEPLTISAEEAEIPVVLLGTEENKMIQLKEAVSRNAANIPMLVNRVGECVEGIHKLDSFNTTRRTIHPAFTKPRITP